MSFDIFVTPFRHGEPDGFDRAILADIFGDGVRPAPTGEIAEIAYPDGQRAELFGAEAESIHHGLMVTRASGERIFDGLWHLADRIDGLIYWPDERPSCALTRAEIADRIPPELLDDLGPVRIVASGSELEACIFGTSAVARRGDNPPGNMKIG